MPPACSFASLHLPACHLGSHAARHSGPSAAIVQGWITAIATLVLAVFAIVTAILATLAYRKQSKEVRTLVKQYDRDVADRHRAQASQVFVLANPYIREGEPVSSIEVTVKNTSQQPIYDLACLPLSGLRIL